MTMFIFPRSPSAPLDPARAAQRHPVEWAKLVAKLGGAPHHVQYECAYGGCPGPIDITGVSDYRATLAAHVLPLINKLQLVGLPATGKKVRVNIDLATITSANAPLELWGSDPADRAQWPSLWLLDVNNDPRFLGWTQWRLAGLVRRRQTTPKYQMPWHAVVFRGLHEYVLTEGVSDPNQLYTFREHVQLREAVAHGHMPNVPEISERMRYYPGVSGLGCWDPLTNKPGGFIPAKDHHKWEFLAARHGVAQDWVRRHCVSIGGRLYPQTQRVSRPLANVRYLDENSSTDQSVEAIFAWQRGEKTYTAQGRYADPVQGLRAGVNVLPGFKP